MAGRILNAAAREDLADCLIKAAAACSTRAGLIAIWKAGNIGLGKSKLLEIVTAACQDQQIELDAKQDRLLKYAGRFK